MNGRRIEKINAATDQARRTASHKLAEAMYKAPASRLRRTVARGRGRPEPPRRRVRKPKDNVVDAEFVDVDDKK